MKRNIFTTILFVFFGLNVFAVEAAKKEIPLGWTLGFETDMYVLEAEDEVALRANTSHFFARFNGQGNGKTKYEDLFDSKNNMTGLTFNVQISMLPNLLEDDVEEALSLKLEQRLQQAIPQITQLVTLAANSNPAFRQLPPAVQQQLISQQVQNQVNTIRAQKTEQNSERLDQVSKELTYQEITIGKPFDMGNGKVAYLKLGKEKVEAHPDARNDERVTPDLAKTLGSTGGTGFVAVGTQFRTADGLIITSEVRVFSERPTYIEAFDYLARYVNASEEQFNAYKNIFSLNSVNGKIEFSTSNENLQGGINYAHHDGFRGNEFSAWLNFAVADTVQVELANFEGQNGLQATSVVISKYFTPRLSAYLRRSFIKGYDDSTTSAQEKINYTETAIGSAFRFATLRIWKVDCDTLLKLEVAHRNGFNDSKKWDPALGATVRCQN